MKSFFNYKFLSPRLREYIFIFLTATIFSLIFISKSLAEENVFVIKNIKVNGIVDLNFTRDKYINKAFLKSFDLLMSKILLSKDILKFKNLKLSEIKKLTKNFQILSENYKKDEYEAIYRIVYDHQKIKNLLIKKNIPYSQPKNISVIFLPILFINDELISFNKNFFYNNWENIDIKNDAINFILPIEDLDDISKLEAIKNNFENFNILSLVNKYDVKNYVFSLIDFNNKKLNIHIKTSFDNNKISKNVNYKLDSIDNVDQLNKIAEDLKMEITDIWKKTNIINLLMPLSINIKFQHKNLIDLDKLKSSFKNISIVKNYNLEEININYSYFKIYYYGNPKKLKRELTNFGYNLRDDQGQWELYIND